KIESKIECAPHARIFKFIAPGIEHESLHHAAVTNRKLLAHDALFADSREIVRRGPIFRAVLESPVQLVALEAFERHSQIAKIFVADLLEISCTDNDVEILAPIVVHLFVDQRAARSEFRELVRSAAKRRL